MAPVSRVTTPHQHECKPCQDCYVKGCGCLECREAHRKYGKIMHRVRARPDWDNPKVKATKARTHLLAMEKQGFGIKSLSEITGVTELNLRMIRRGERKIILKRTESAILAAQSDPKWVRKDEAEEATAHIKWVHSKGYSYTQMSEVCGVHKETIRKVSKGEVIRMRREYFTKIMALNLAMFEDTQRKRAYASASSSS